MTDAITITLVDTATVRLGRLTEESRGRLRAAIVRDGQRLAARIRGKVGGGVLKVRSGRLLNSIKTEMVENQFALYGRVYSSGVPYADMVAEHGGQTKPHDIRPRNAKALHFMAAGGDVFAMVVHHPGSKFPARMIFSGTLEEMKDEIVADLTEAGRPKWA